MQGPTSAPRFSMIYDRPMLNALCQVSLDSLYHCIV
jgi:hypothetical protein